MLLPRTLDLVWLLCSIITVCECIVGANATSQCYCYRKTCVEKEHNIHKTVCLHPEAGFSCCEEQAFNPATATCCKVGHGSNVTANVTEGLSEKVSSCCGLKAYDSLNEICCGTTIIAKPGPKSQCCGQEAIDADKHLCCGKNDSKKILMKTSSDHQCCGPDKQYNTKTERCCFTDQGFEIQSIKHNCCKNESELHCGPVKNRTILRRNSSDHQCCGPEKQYNTKTECCCFTDQGFEIQSIKHNCCKNESGVQQQKHGASPKCTEAQTNLCGSSCYHLKKILCCKKKQTKSHLCSVPGHCDAVYSPYTHICRDGCLSERTPQTEQFNGLHRQNCCGTEVNHTEICCDGHRHPKVGHMYCCGTRAYNIKNQQMKCCSGTLYNLTLFNMSEHEVQCCGSALKNKQDVCCLGEDKEVLYSAKKGFRCCAHHYYNTSLWSCCAGCLSPRHHQNRKITESTLLSMDNITETHLCKEILIGIVASVSQHQHSIAFNNVLEIHGRNGTLTPLASPHILKTPGCCNFTKVTPGKTYFFDRVNMYTDFNHDSILQSIHFIFTKCSHHEVIAG